MKLFVGLDVSLNSTAVCVVDVLGNIKKEASVDSTPQAIDRFLARLEHPIERVGLETGQISTWLFEGLQASGWTVVCLEARHLNAVLKAQSIKTDRNDARGIAQAVRTGWYKEVHIKSRESQEVRAILTYRTGLVRTKVDLSNQLRGILRSFGMKIGKTTQSQYEDRVRALISDFRSPGMVALAERLLTMRQEVIREIASIDSELKQHARRDDVCRLLMTAPGVGYLVAIAYKSAVDDPSNFKKSRDVGAFLGLTPRRYASGEMDYVGRITKCGDTMARTLLYEGAGSFLARVKRKSCLKDWAEAIERRSGRKKAVVALARKLSVVLHRMWLNGAPFDWRTA